MGKINWGRVVLGGLLAGVVLNAYDFVMNGMVLAAQWNASLQGLGKGPMGASMIVWFVLSDFLLGLWAIWLYAAIRPRYGAGPKTALWAGLAGWFVMGLVNTISMMPMGLFPASLYHWNLIGSLVMFPVAAIVGAAIYQEA